MSVTFNIPLFDSYSPEAQDHCMWKSPRCGTIGPTGPIGSTGINGNFYAGGLTGPIAYASSQGFTGSIPLYSSYSSTRKDVCTNASINCDNSGLYTQYQTLLGYISAKAFSSSIPLWISYSPVRQDYCTYFNENCGDPNVYGPNAVGPTGQTGTSVFLGYASAINQTVSNPGGATGATGPAPIPTPEKTWIQKYWWTLLIAGGVLLLLIIIIIIVAARKK